MSWGMTPKQIKAREQNAIQLAQVAQAVRVINEEKMTFEEVAKCAPFGITAPRWRAMLRRTMKDSQ